MSRLLARHRRGIATLCAAAIAAPLAAQAPVVERVEPPNWWAGSTVNPVRLLIRGRNLAGARLGCGRLRCGHVRVSASGTWLLADVSIPPSARPGRYPLALRTPGGRDTIPFTVSPRLAAPGRFQGFGPNDVVYLLMPDRFANGDTANDDPAASRGLHDRRRPRYYHGGDLAGVRQRLPYLRDLGVTAIWMNPIYDNNNRLNRRETYEGQPITDYHGYGATDFYAVDEHLGDLDGFRRLVDDAHAHGIKVILDMVANHTGPYHPWVQDPPKPSWLHGTETRHLANTWQTWTLADPHATAATRQATLDGWFIDILPDLDQDDPDVARYLVQNTLWWVGMSGLDGIRQDTWPYVPRSFWRSWMAAIKREYPRVRVVGEVFDGDPAMIAFFEGGRAQFDGIDTGVDMLFDFPLYFPIRRAFGEGRSLREVAQMLARDRLYRDPANLVTFAGLHDVQRFMNEPGATVAGLRLAFTFLLTTRGTPLVYYGDEIALPGGNDPDNRRDFPGGWAGDESDAFTASGRTPDQQAVWSHVQRLLRLRAARPELRGRVTTNLHVDDQVWVYRRGRTVVALNNGAAPARVTLPIARLPDDALGVCGPARPEGGGVTIDIPPRSGCVF